MSEPPTDSGGRVPEEAAKLLPELYRDTLQPAAREIGSALGRAVRMTLAPVRGLAWTWEHAETWLQDAVERRLESRRVAPEDVKPPPPQILAGVIRGVQAAGPETD